MNPCNCKVQNFGRGRESDFSKLPTAVQKEDTRILLRAVQKIRFRNDEIQVKVLFTGFVELKLEVPLR